MTPTLVLVGYLLGSIPFALLLGGAELRRVGSGNLGAANVLRVRRTSIALTVLALDVAKGGAAVLLASGVNAGTTTTAVVGGAPSSGTSIRSGSGSRGGRVSPPRSGSSRCSLRSPPGSRPVCLA